MFENYKEPYEYVTTQAEDIYQAVKKNNPTLKERVASIPEFFRDGLQHMRDVKAVYPLMFIKLILLALVTGISAFVTFYAFENLEPMIAVTGQSSGQDQQYTWGLYVLLGIIWIPYLALVSLLEGLLNGAMGAATYLQAKGHPATVRNSLMIAMQNAPTIWKFSIIQIVFRFLTSSTKNSGLLADIAKEALRMAWTYGTIGMMPAILNGKGLLDAVKRSTEFIKTKPVKIISLLFARSICSALLMVAVIGLSILVTLSGIYALYIFPAALFLLMFFIHPIYVSVLYMLYVNFLEEKKYPLEAKPGQDSGALVKGIMIIYVLLTGSVIAIGMFM